MPVLGSLRGIRLVNAAEKMARGGAVQCGRGAHHITQADTSEREGNAQRKSRGMVLNLKKRRVSIAKDNQTRRERLHLSTVPRWRHRTRVGMEISFDPTEMSKSLK